MDFEKTYKNINHVPSVKVETGVIFAHSFDWSTIPKRYCNWKLVKKTLKLINEPIQANQNMDMIVQNNDEIIIGEKLKQTGLNISDMVNGNKVPNENVDPHCPPDDEFNQE